MTGLTLILVVVGVLSAVLLAALGLYVWLRDLTEWL